MCMNRASESALEGEICLSLCFPVQDRNDLIFLLIFGEPQLCWTGTGGPRLIRIWIIQIPGLFSLMEITYRSLSYVNLPT